MSDQKGCNENSKIWFTKCVVKDKFRNLKIQMKLKENSECKSSIISCKALKWRLKMSSNKR